MSKYKQTKELAVLMGIVLREIRGGDARHAGSSAKSQGEVGEALGYHQNYISMVERGVNVYPLHRILDVCDAYGCKPDELIQRFAKAVKGKAKSHAKPAKR